MKNKRRLRIDHNRRLVCRSQQETIQRMKTLSSQKFIKVKNHLIQQEKASKSKLHTKHESKTQEEELLQHIELFQKRVKNIMENSISRYEQQMKISAIKLFVIYLSRAQRKIVMDSWAVLMNSIQ